MEVGRIPTEFSGTACYFPLGVLLAESIQHSWCGADFGNAGATIPSVVDCFYDCDTRVGESLRDLTGVRE